MATARLETRKVFLLLFLQQKKACFLKKRCEKLLSV